MPSRRLWLSVTTRIVVCSALLALAMLILFWLVSSAPKPEIADQSAVRVRVVVVPAEPTTVRRQWHGFGTASAVHAADVPARITAVVHDRPDHIRPGRAVTQGETLLLLDDSDFARQVEIASQNIEDLEAQLVRLDVERRAWSERAQVTEEELALARAELDRASRAFEGDAAKQREVDLKRQAVLAIERTAIATREELEKVPLRRASLEATKRREEAALKLARLNLERCRIVAPIDGVLAAVDVNEGENVVAGQRVARIVNLRRIEVPLLLPSSARAQVRLNDEVTLSSESGTPPLTWQAQISRIAPDDDPDTRTMRVFAEVLQDPSSDRLLAPGMFVRGMVTAHAAPAGDMAMRTVIPRRSISAQRIMVVEQDRIRTLPVTVDFHLEGARPATGVPDTQWAVLRERLPDGTLVVLDGSRGLADGVPVLPVRADAQLAQRSEHQSRNQDTASVRGTP